MNWELVEAVRQVDLFGIVTLDQVMLGVALGAVVRWVLDLDVGLGTAAVFGVIGMALQPVAAQLVDGSPPPVLGINVVYAVGAVLLASGVFQVFQR